MCDRRTPRHRSFPRRGHRHRSLAYFPSIPCTNARLRPMSTRRGDYSVGSDTGGVFSDFREVFFVLPRLQNASDNASYAF
jgi:hypothetical protein